MLLTALEAAERLGVSSWTIGVWAKEGRIPNAQKVGQVWAIPEESLEKIDFPKMGRPRKKRKPKDE